MPGDLIAGLTLAAIAIPEQMATARLGGFAPQIGFFAFIAGSIGFAMFGANRFLSCGADSTITPIFAGGLLLMAASGSPDYQALAVALALMVGVILILGSLFRMGWIANLLSVPVTVGFLAGISVHILVSQMPGVLGLPSPKGPMLDRIIELAQHARRGQPLHARDRARRARHRRGIGSDQRQNSRRADRAGRGHDRGDLRRARSQGRQPWSAPCRRACRCLRCRTSLPRQWAKLVPLALLIAIVVMVQTAATTRAFPSDPDKPADVDRDFLGVGAGSVLAGLFGAFPVDASPPRTGIVSETGGRTQLSSLFAAAIVLALLAFGATLLRHVPEAALGGVLLFVALRIIRVRQIVQVYRQSPGEFLLIVATAAAIIVLPIEQGVAVGIGLSLLHGIWTITRARLIDFEHVPDTTIWWPAGSHIAGRTASRRRRGRPAGAAVVPQCREFCAPTCRTR